MLRPKRRFFSTHYIGLIGVAAILVALAPIAIEPMLNSDKYKKIQNVTRKGVKQEEIQPGNMRVWSDPFGKKSKQSEEDSEL